MAIALDLSCGVAAVKAGRRFVGYDTNPQYVELAQKRIAEIQKENMT